MSYKPGPLPESRYSLGVPSDGYNPDRILNEAAYTETQVKGYAALEVAKAVAEVATAARADIARLNAEIAALKDQAEKYRWLQNGGQYVVDCPGGAKFFCGGHTVQQGTRGYAKAFDEGVTKAMKERP